MPYRTVLFENDSFYHIFNRGVEKRKIFLEEKDYDRFLQILYYYQFSGPKPKFSNRKRFKSKDYSSNPKIVEIVCYCLMPNHFHLLLKQLKDNGIQEFLAKISNSYTKYFNTKNDRVGPLFQGSFKAVEIESDVQLLHVSRYIHLNPYVADLVKDLNVYLYSSYPDFIDLAKGQICNKDLILNYFKIPNEYKEFVVDHQEYAHELEKFKHLYLDDF
jgi:putative transposase